MSGAGRSGDWASARNRSPRVTVVSTGTAGPPGSRGRANANTHGVYVWIVMPLLIATTALALYDLYLLGSLLAL